MAVGSVSSVPTPEDISLVLFLLSKKALSSSPTRGLGFIGSADVAAM